MVTKKKNSKLKLFLKIFFSVILILIISGGIIGYHYYKKIYYPNIIVKDKDYLYIPTGSTFQDVVRIIENRRLVKDINSFEWVAELKKYPEKVRAGKYLLRKNMNNNELVNLLRAGLQTPVMVVFNNARTKEQLAGKVSKNIEADSSHVISLLDSDSFVTKYGFNSESIMTMFIPNSYELFWNTSAEQFFDRIATEYKQFWSDERKNKAKSLGLSQSEVSILASIVEQETIKKDERPRVAGVYLNRLKKKILLQADPTVIYAMGDFTIKRVLREYLNYDSPYNTYKYVGLPPGPICLPSISSIDAVLNSEKHDYIFFCAKEDFSGYHNFAKTAEQHGINAVKYRMALNKRKIYK
ncbi:MAG: aminodeoxychorismate lyase [Bacteroidetes bacterium GWA2_30_7]|nr:MAG: aminodeoxychorismate lyase [Bacteroidetes bacterium GWA2_30_7]